MHFEESSVNTSKLIIKNIYKFKTNVARIHHKIIDGQNALAKIRKKFLHGITVFKQKL